MMLVPPAILEDPGGVLAPGARPKGRRTNARGPRDVKNTQGQPMTPDELRALTRELGWTQKTAAERLGVRLRTYGYYEAGKTSSGAKLEHIPKAVAIAMHAYRLRAPDRSRGCR
jgi:DNA-binding XRE family transcriptional regulator